jgi:hypothetical protein
LQEEKDDNICQDEDVDEVRGDRDKEEMVPSKLGHVWELPLSPPTYDSNPNTEKSIAIHDFVVLNDDVDASEEYVLEMLYDNAWDDGPMILDDPPCLEISTTMCEDKNDMLVISDDTIMHESPIVFLNSPNHTLEEKYACVENYLYGLQLSYVCNHDAMIENRTSNHFERGKHVVGCHDNSVP